MAATSRPTICCCRWKPRRRTMRLSTRCWAKPRCARSALNARRNYRNDFGVYGDWRVRLDQGNQVGVGLEVRQRRYPTGPLRERTRNIVELSGNGSADCSTAMSASSACRRRSASASPRTWAALPSLVAERALRHRTPGRGRRPPAGHRHAQRQPVRGRGWVDLAVPADLVVEPRDPVYPRPEQHTRGQLQLHRNLDHAAQGLLRRHDGQ